MRNLRTILSFTKFSILIFAFLLGSLPIPAAAYSIDFFQGNDILWYNPDGSGGCVNTAKSYSTRNDIPSLSGGDNAEKVWNYLTSSSVGLSPEQAAGLMGNINQESGFKPDAEEGPESYARHTVRPVGYGIVQWTGGRRTALEKAANDQNVAVSDLGFQLAFMVQESQSRTVDSFVLGLAEGRDFGKSGDNEWETLKKQKTVEDAAAFWHAAFERSGDSASQINERLDDGKIYLEQFGSSSAGGGRTGSRSSGGANCSPSSFGGGDLTETLLAYAHPTHTPYAGDNRVNPEPKPAYVEAATKFQKEGKWVGGGNIEGGLQPVNPFPAIDCGGFVSILLINSGVEPDYNFGLDMERGASNQAFGQLPWAQRNWKFLGYGGEINVSDLRPGDVAFSNGHTFIYVGQVDGFEGMYASSSYDLWRAPMAGGTYETATSPDYVWYGRREGTPPEYGSTKMDDPIPAGNNIFPGNSQQGRNW